MLRHPTARYLLGEPFRYHLPVVTAAAEKPLILFDGECNLCDGFVQFVIRRDPRARFRFAALRSRAAAEALAAAGHQGALPDSIVLVCGRHVRTKSGAVLAILRRLRGLWPLTAAFWLTPSLLRDGVYDVIARRRIRWFGRRDTCWVPTPELQARFADLDERRSAS